MQQEKDGSLLLRIQVTSGGCHGFQYLMSLTTPSSPSPQKQQQQQQKQEEQEEEDTIFQATDGTDAKIIMDEASLELLRDSKVDYTSELIGSQFRIVDNPRAKSSCGCGTSFDVAEDREEGMLSTESLMS